MFEKLSNSFFGTPKTSRPIKEKPILEEWRLGLIGLIVSLLVIITKLFFAYEDGIKHYLFERRLFSFEVINEDGNIMIHHTWKTVVKYSNVWFPVLCGGLATYFTWLMVYLDSDVPGVQPPSPFSPTKYKAKSGHSFHLNYVFAVAVGLLITAYMFWRNVSIDF